MGVFSNLFGKKASEIPDAPEPPRAAAYPRTYYFICTGNPSLIAAYDSLLRPGVVPWNGEAGSYSFEASDLDSHIKQAEEESLAFDGQRYMGSSGTEVATVADALRGMRAGAFGTTYVEYAAVERGGVAWVREVYDTLLKEAISQGILPFYVFITTNGAAARFIVESFQRIR